jgi:uncharacterized protein YjiS (DUF1127 family)
MMPLGGFATVWRRLLLERMKRTKAHRELAALDDRQLDDIGLKRDELVLVVAGAAEAPERVGMMAGRLGVDPEAFEARRPLLNEMVKRCAACRTKVICAWWLAEGGAEDAYREFCPNAGRFLELRRYRP